MIYINLLPWREARSKTRKLNLLARILLATLLPWLLVGLIWIIYSSQLKQKNTQLEHYQITNKQVLSFLDHFKSKKSESEKYRQLVNNLNQLIEQRQKLPEVLSTVAQKHIAQHIEYLSIDHTFLQIKGTESLPGDAVQLFQFLRGLPFFCQLAYLPTGQHVNSSQALAFELKATLCNVESGD